jgi:hypothetical protein
MKRKRRKTKSLIGLLVLAGILASSAYAFTASIAVNGTYQAGDSGAKVIAPARTSLLRPGAARMRLRQSRPWRTPPTCK